MEAGRDPDIRLSLIVDPDPSLELALDDDDLLLLVTLPRALASRIRTRLADGPEIDATSLVLALAGPPPTAVVATTDAADALAPLTLMERRIAELVTHGQTNRAIAVQLNLAEKTVRNYVSRMLDKLQVSNRTELAARVVRLGLGA